MTSLSDEPAHSVRADLEHRRDELRTRYLQLSSDLRRVRAPLDRDMDEQSIELENGEVLERLELATRRELGEVLGALDRLEAGTYGICTACHGSIEPDRLAALPYTHLCITCAERLELT